MSRTRASLSDEQSARVWEIVGPVRLTWRDRLWDVMPGLVLLAFLWLAVLTLTWGWFLWREFAR